MENNPSLKMPLFISWFRWQWLQCRATGAAAAVPGSNFVNRYR